MTKMLSSPEGDQPRLLAEAQEGEADEPLALGLTVEHASDGTTVTIEGLPDDFDLSFGNRSDNSWTIAATDLEQTFVGAPTGFVGMIETTATLRAGSGRLLDRQVLRFEWRANKGEPSDQAPVDTMIKETRPAGIAAVTPSAQSSLPKSVVPLPLLAVPAVTAKAIECQSSPPPNNQSHWAWRLVENKKCWYSGQPGMDKSKLYWATNANQVPEPAQRTAPPLCSIYIGCPKNDIRAYVDQ